MGRIAPDNMDLKSMLLLGSSCADPAARISLRKYVRYSGVVANLIIATLSSDIYLEAIIVLGVNVNPKRGSWSVKLFATREWSTKVAVAAANTIKSICIVCSVSSSQFLGSTYGLCNRQAPLSIDALCDC